MNGMSNEPWLKREDSERKVGEWRMPSKRELSREELLGTWLGEERQASVFADLRAMKSDMGALIEGVLSEVGQEEVMLLTKLQEDWIQIVGPDNAKMSKPLSLSQGNLRIRVLNSAYKFIFERQMKATFLKQLSERSQGAIKRIDFV